MKKFTIGIFVAVLFFVAGILSKKNTNTPLVVDKVVSKKYLSDSESVDSEATPSADDKSENTLKLEKIAGNNVLAKQIVQIMHINSLEEKNPTLTPEREEAVKELQRMPKDAIKQIDQLLKNMPEKGFELERLRLLVLSSYLDGVTEERKEIAHREMLSQIPEKRPDPNNAQTEEELNQALSTTFEMAVPMVAHGILLGTITDKEEALTKTIEGVSVQQEPYIQRGIVNQFLQMYPDQKKRITDELSARNIDPFQSYEDNDATKSNTDVSDVKGSGDVKENSD